MSRSDYSEDCEHLALWRQAVRRAATGYRGQAFLRKLLAVLDAMPSKRLITNAIQNESGEVCVLGALDPKASAYHAKGLAVHFGIARALAAEIVYMNDEQFEWRGPDETPEQRWTRMRGWVEAQIVQPQSVDAVDPQGGSGKS